MEPEARILAMKKEAAERAAVSAQANANQSVAQAADAVFEEVLQYHAHGLQQAVNDVTAFHRKHDFPVGVSLTIDDMRHGEQPILHYTALQLSTMSKELLHHYSARKDSRMLRLSLILEEASELALALTIRNEELALDALADLIYVVVGTAVTYDLPLAEGFREVQASNMTKAARKADDPRLREKGSSYKPADLAGVLKTYRSKK